MILVHDYSSTNQLIQSRLKLLKKKNHIDGFAEKVQQISTLRY